MFDHELKISRARNHLHELNQRIDNWIKGDNHSVGFKTDPDTGVLTVLATAKEQPPDGFSLLIGDALHNFRSGLDNLAYALAGAYTIPLPDDIASDSEFPIFGDENRKGQVGVGKSMFNNPNRGGGIYKIRGWNPAAHAVVEGLQPYQRGKAFREHPLWILHELDRVNKHRLLHATIAHFAGVGFRPATSRNIAGISAGTIESLSGPIETDTPIARFPKLIPVDPTQEMYMDVQPALDVAFAKGPPVAEYESVRETLGAVERYIIDEVVPTLTPYL